MIKAAQLQWAKSASTGRWKRCKGWQFRKFKLYISADSKYFKKQTDRLHKKLAGEYDALKIVKKLNLPHFQVLADGEITDDISYIMTEHCGDNLNVRKKRIPANYKEQLTIIQQGLDILMNDYKIYHNDVLPRNIMVDTEGKLTLIDFDLVTTGFPKKPSRVFPAINNTEYLINWCKRNNDLL